MRAACCRKSDKGLNVCLPVPTPKPFDRHRPRRKTTRRGIQWVTAKMRICGSIFDRTLKLKFLGSKVITYTGLLANRELDEALGLTELGAHALEDSRLGKNKQHGPLGLLRQSIYSRLAGYEDVNDAKRLCCIDPAMRHVVGGRASQEDKQAASMSEMGRFETEILWHQTELEGADGPLGHPTQLREGAVGHQDGP